VGLVYVGTRGLLVGVICVFNCQACLLVGVVCVGISRTQSLVWRNIARYTLLLNSQLLTPPCDHTPSSLFSVVSHVHTYPARTGGHWKSKEAVLVLQ